MAKAMMMILCLLFNTLLISDGDQTDDDIEDDDGFDDPDFEDEEECDGPYPGEVNTLITLTNDLIGEPIKIQSATQSATGGSNVAANAIDGNKDTYSVSIPGGNEKHAWWQGDVGDYYSIDGIKIVSSTDHANAQNLKNFTILISSYNHTHDPIFQQARTCLRVCDERVINTGTSFTYKCSLAVTGRFIIVKSFGAAVSLAEVTAYLEKL